MTELKYVNVKWPDDSAPFGLWLEGAEAALSEMSRDVAGALSRVLADSSALGALVDCAYLHPGGFRKYTLRSSPNGARLRLHIWPHGTKGDGSAGDPHDHRWNFCSLPLTAPMFEERFVIDRTAVEKAWIAVRCDERVGEVIDAHVVAPSALRLESTHIRPVGSAYACPHTAIHRLRPASDMFTATLVITSRPQRAERPIAFKAHQQMDAMRTIQAPTLNIAEAADDIRLLVASLHVAHTSSY